MKTKALVALFAISLVCFVPVKSQRNPESRDKYTLLTMPYNKRPLALYRGQLQINTGYKFAVRSRTYDSDGNSINLKDFGTASVYHNFFMELRYGITDFIELSAETDYLKKGVRSMTIETISSELLEDIQVSTLNETRGFGDIVLFATIRLPVTYSWYDVSLRGGISLPVASYKPAEPTHTITDIITPTIYTINCHYNNRNGLGVPVYHVSAAAKLTWTKYSFKTDFTFTAPVKEGTSIRWNEVMEGMAFIYYSTPYQYLLSRSFNLNASLHYQASGWLDVKLNTVYFSSGNGWTEYWGNKYRNPEERLFILEPGFEIQVSPSLRIYETAGFSLGGKSIDGPFYLFLTASFNIFPFFK